MDAQSPLALERDGSTPRVVVGNILDDPALEAAVQSGLPLRMRFRIELWRDQLFDDLVDQASWVAVVAFEPLERHYLAGLLQSDSLGRYPSWSEARVAVERPYRPTLREPGSGRYYYIATLEIETLSLSDLDELERWLRGELEPAVRGRRSVSGAVGAGLKRILIRILGFPARRFEVRSERFRIP